MPPGTGSLPANLGLSAEFMVNTFETFVARGVCGRVLARPRILDRVRRFFAAPGLEISCSTQNDVDLGGCAAGSRPSAPG